jgi:hypothetical protein
MSAIFYSQVNKSVQDELIERGAAGTANRTTKALDYMLGKITNVQIEAFDSKPKPGQSIMKTEQGFGLLGGFSVRGNAYMPSSEFGYLNDKVRPANRIPPIITDVSIAINDQSKSYINKASVSILISDADTDLEEMEQVYCKPGRYVRIIYVMPDSAILSSSPLLQDDGLPSTDFLKKQYPDVDLSNLRKMNEFYFQGRISTFSYSYNADGSISLTFEAIGTSNTYADIGVYIKNEKQPTETEEKPANQVGNLYTLLSDEINTVIAAKQKDNITEFEFLSNGTTDQGILVGIPYTIGNSTTPGTERMMSLGYLIQFINSKLMEQVGASITCNDTICKSNLYEKLVSADPQNVLLWRGKADIQSDTYSWDHSTELAKSRGYTQTRQWLPNITSANAASPGFSDGTDAYPSRIYINIELIRKIITDIKDDPTIKNLLIHLSDAIRINTGNAINMVLVQDPLISDALIYCDANYVKTNVNIFEFTLPAFATKTGRSVVRDFSLTSNVPNSVKNMIFGIDSWDTGNQKQTAFNPYIYADGETRTKLANDWKRKYTETSINLSDIKYEKVQKPVDPETIKKLQDILAKYVTWFTPNIEDSMQLNKSIFPMELEFTIDGINGLKYGDVLSFDGLPKRYTESFVFTILGITHAVSNEGEWTTQVKCNPRIRIKGK